MHFCGDPQGSSCDDSVDKYTNWVFPKQSTRSDDLVLNMLAKIQCLTPDGDGGQTRTKLALNMHTMRGDARQLPRRRRSGRSSPRAATSGSATG